MPVSDINFFIIFISMLSVTAFTTILLIMVITMSPGLTFMKAKLRKKPILASRRRDRRIDFHVADQYIEGMVVSKKYKAGYIVDPDAVYNDMKTGVPIMPVESEIGIVISPRILRIIDGLKRMGIKNIDEAETYNALWGVCTGCGYEGIMTPRLENGKIVKLLCPQDEEGIENERREFETEDNTPSGEEEHADNSTGEDVQLW